MNNKLDRSPIGATIFSFELFRKKKEIKNEEIGYAFGKVTELAVL